MCHASTCLSQGAEAVLAEIEELVSVVGVKCNVRAGGCLGFCRSAPAAAVISTGANDLNPSDVHVRVQSLESSAKVVKHATGKLPSLDDAFTRGRLAGLREMRSRQHAVRLCNSPRSRHASTTDLWAAVNHFTLECGEQAVRRRDDGPVRQLHIALLYVLQVRAGLPRLADRPRRQVQHLVAVLLVGSA